MENYYKPAATVWARTKNTTLREWLRTWNMTDASLTIECSSPLAPSPRAEDAAMWMWYMAARKAGDKLTLNADDVGNVSILTWKYAARMVPGLIHPAVYAISQPYQLVIA